jgi:hypothetical protein
MPHTSHSHPPTTSEEIVVCRSARLSSAAYKFYRAVLLTFVERGDAPEPAAMRQLAARFGVPFHATLSNMASQDLVQRDPATGRIRAAYPFSGVPTPHRVTLFAIQSGEPKDQRDVQVFAMCALDALGIPLMLGRSAEIVSQDALSGEPIRVMMCPAGDLASDPASLRRLLPLDQWLATWEPLEAVVYARSAEHEAEHDAGLCVAAGSCCPVTNFFARVANADAWASQRQVSVDGIALGQHEALARAHSLFAGVLDRDVLANSTAMAHQMEKRMEGEGNV